MKINLENYEAYLIDYLEGNLNKEIIEELEAFLDLNPQLRESFTQYTVINIEPAPIIFKGKQELYKYKFDRTPVNKRTYSDFCIAYYENLLDDTKKAELLNFVKNNQTLANEFILFGKTYLTPETHIFREKYTLYKRKITHKIFISNPYFWSSVAAGIAILFGVYFYKFNNANTIPDISLNNQIRSVQPKDNNLHATNTGKHIKILNNNTLRHRSKKVEKPNKTIGIEKINPDEDKIKFIEPLIAKVYSSYEGPNELKISADNKYFAVSVSNKSMQYSEHSNSIYNIEDFGKRNLLLTIAESAFNQLNKVSNREIASINHKSNKEGKIYAYSFKAGFLEFSRSKNNKIE